MNQYTEASPSKPKSDKISTSNNIFFFAHLHDIKRMACYAGLILAHVEGFGRGFGSSGNTMFVCFCLFAVISFLSAVIIKTKQRSET